MEFTYKEIRNGLLKYFTKIEEYKFYRSKISQGVVYFYSSKQEYNIIKLGTKVAPIEEDEELKTLISKMQTSAHHQPKVLILTISNNVAEPKTIKPGFLEILTDEQNLKTKLEPLFARINALKIESSDNSSFFKRASKIDNPQQQETKQEFNIEENFTDLFDFAGAEKELKAFIAKTSPNRLILTWILLALFGLAPISGVVVCGFLNLDFYELRLGLAGLEKLFTGGTNYALTIAGKQWWRMLTWGFAVPGSGALMNVVILFAAGYAFYTVNKYSETTIGILKTFLTFLIAYFLTGFFVSVMMPTMITGGILPVLAIALGILIANLGACRADNALKARFIRTKILWPILPLVIFPIFLGGPTNYIAIVVGLGFGASLMHINLISKKSKPTTIVYGLVFLTLLILPIAFLIVPSFTPALDQRIVYTLMLYVQNNFLPNVDYANSIFEKIGWAIRLEEFPGWGIGITGLF